MQQPIYLIKANQANIIISEIWLKAVLVDFVRNCMRAYYYYDTSFAIHCLMSNREGLGMSLKIMGLATIDPHSHKVQSKLYKIPKFDVNRPS